MKIYSLMIATTFAFNLQFGIAEADPTDCAHDELCLAALVHGMAPNPMRNETSALVPVQNPAIVSAALQSDARGFTPGIPSPPTNLETVWLPKGTLFPVQTMQSYSSYGTAPGGKVRYELLQDVYASGQLIAMKGDTAEGTIQGAMTGTSFPFFFGRAANLRVSVDHVYNFCGDTIAVDFDRSETRKNRIGWLSGLLMGMPDSDVDVHIIRGQEYMAFSDRPQRVCSVPGSGAQTAPKEDRALWTTVR